MTTTIWALFLCFSATAAAEPGDAQLTAILSGKLAKSTLAAEPVKFRVKGGTVTWTGRVSVPQRKGAATRMAKAAGAKNVVNEILVAGGAGKKPVKTAGEKRVVVAVGERAAGQPEERAAARPAEGEEDNPGSRRQPRQVRVIIPGRK